MVIRNLELAATFPSSNGPSVEEVYHDAALQFLNVQIATAEELDARTYQMFTIGSTVLPVTFALLNLAGDEAPSVAGWMLGAALIVYLALIGCAIRATRQRRFDYRPNIATLASLIDSYRSVPQGGSLLHEWVAREYQFSIDANRPLLATKGRWVGRMSAMLFVECVCLAVAAGLTLAL